MTPEIAGNKSNYAISESLLFLTFEKFLGYLQFNMQFPKNYCCNLRETRETLMKKYAF